MTTQRIDGRRGGARRAGVPLLAFVAVQVVLNATAFALGERLGQVLFLIAAALGAGALTYGVLRLRPEPLLAWRLILSSTWLILGSGVATGVIYGFRRDADITAVAPVVLSGLSLLALMAGLVTLARHVPHGGIADGLDAVMTALAIFLLVWVFVIDESLGDNISTLTVAVAFPVGCVMVFTIAVQLVLGGGIRDPSVAMVMLAVVALLASFALVLLPALGTSALRTGTVISLLAGVYYALLGAAGLHPGLAHRTYVARVDTGAMSPRRIVLFAVLALVPPFCWAAELAHHHETGRPAAVIAVPVVISAAFLLLLVARLGLIARIGQQRAVQLGRRTGALAQAVSDQEALEQQLTYRALHDPLTGLANRIVLAERMEWALTRRTETRRHALLLLDLDGFKDINDTLGHPVGDELLIEASHRLLDVAPVDATLARLGGDEFAVFLEDIDADSAVRWAETFLEALRRTYVIGTRELFVTTSIGLFASDSGQRTHTPSGALRDADLALYAAKEAGKNRVMLFHPDMRAARLDHTRISAGLRHALHHDEFVLHYQPVIDLDTRAIVAVEALIRWQPEEGPLIAPADFIAIAEDTGLIAPIGAWALRQACHDARRWWHDHHVAVSVNMAGRQLEDPPMADMLFGILADAGLPGEALIIEITETSLVATSHADVLHRHLQRLRDHGIRIAIDDFGTGYSSLSYVAQLPVDIVKIDKSFTQAHGSTGFEAQDWAFTRAILQLVDSLQLQAVAEGVETSEQAEALRALHCPLVQGYHFSRPVPAVVIDQTLAVSETLLTPVAVRPFQAAGLPHRGP